MTGVDRGSRGIVPGASRRRRLWWAALAWLALIARWRRRGLLTPNVVVVGANANARRLIELEMELRRHRRHGNVRSRCRGLAHPS